SSSGLGHHPLKVATRVRIPLGVPDAANQVTCPSDYRAVVVLCRVVYVMPHSCRGRLTCRARGWQCGWAVVVDSGPWRSNASQPTPLGWGGFLRFATLGSPWAWCLVSSLPDEGST